MLSEDLICRGEFIESGDTKSGLAIARAATISSQRLFAILDGLCHFGDRVGAFRDFIFQLDLRGEYPLLLAHQLEDFLDRSLAFAPRHVAAVGGPVLQM